MKTELFYDRLSEKWVPASVDALLIDRPLHNLKGSNILSALENNILETTDGYKLEVAVPGMRKKDLKLEVANGKLTIQGQKQQKDMFGWLSKTVEFKSTHIYRTIMLPDDADAEGIRAKCKDGLLRISIPRLKRSRKFKSFPVGSVRKTESWWQKLISPFKALKANLSSWMKRIGAGSKLHRGSWL